MNQHIEALDKAENCFHAGKTREGANLVWQAAYAAIKEVAQRHSLPSTTEKEVFTSARVLDDVCPHPYVMHGLYLSIADLYRRQASEEEIPDEIRWDPQEFFENLSGIRLMINNLGNNP